MLQAASADGGADCGSTCWDFAASHLQVTPFEATQVYGGVR